MTHTVEVESIARRKDGFGECLVCFGAGHNVVKVKGTDPAVLRCSYTKDRAS